MTGYFKWGPAESLCLLVNSNLIKITHRHPPYKEKKAPLLGGENHSPADLAAQKHSPCSDLVYFRPVGSQVEAFVRGVLHRCLLYIVLVPLTPDGRTVGFGSVFHAAWDRGRRARDRTFTSMVGERDPRGPLNQARPRFPSSRAQLR